MLDYWIESSEYKIKNITAIVKIKMLAGYKSTATS